MKKFEIAGYSIFVIAVILKLFHVPYNTWCIMSALLILLIGYIGNFLSKKLEPERALAGIATVTWLALFLFLAKFWPFWLVMFSIAVVALIVVIIYRLKNKSDSDIQAVILVVAVMLSLTVFFMPPDRRYYAFNIKFHHDLSNDYITMDKYSWFLYQAGKFDEAEKFSNDAATSAKRNSDPGFAKIANAHHEKIRAKSWEDFSLK
jgi:hypothetical protein